MCVCARVCVCVYVHMCVVIRLFFVLYTGMGIDDEEVYKGILITLHGMVMPIPLLNNSYLPPITSSLICMCLYS